MRWCVGLVRGEEADRLGRQQASVLLRISRWRTQLTQVDSTLAEADTDPDLTQNQ